MAKKETLPNMKEPRGGRLSKGSQKHLSGRLSGESSGLQGRANKFGAWSKRLCSAARRRRLGKLTRVRSSRGGTQNSSRWRDGGIRQPPRKKLEREQQCLRHPRHGGRLTCGKRRGSGGRSSAFTYCCRMLAMARRTT